MKSIKKILLTVQQKMKIMPSYEEMERALEERDRQLAEEERKKAEGPLGDGKAVFMEEGTEEEFDRFVEEEERGWKGFFTKIFNLNNENETNN